MVNDLLPEGRSAWITGASSGIGRALALRLAAAGVPVIASARGADDLRELARDAGARGGSIMPLPLDVTDRAAVAEAVGVIERTAPLGLAVLNAGTHAPLLARDFEVERLRKLVELNLLGTGNCLEAALPVMLARGEGHIAIVGSVAGYFGLPTSAGYGATKAGLINMAEALQPELKAAGIKLQIVNPGFVRTPLTDKNPFPMPFLMEPEEAAEAFYRGLRAKRFEIVFPRRLAYLLKFLRMLPYGLALTVTRRLVPKPESEEKEERGKGHPLPEGKR